MKIKILIALLIASIGLLVYFVMEVKKIRHESDEIRKERERLEMSIEKYKIDIDYLNTNLDSSKYVIASYEDRYQNLPSKRYKNHTKLKHESKRLYSHSTDSALQLFLDSTR